MVWTASAVCYLVLWYSFDIFFIPGSELLMNCRDKFGPTWTVVEPIITECNVQGVCPPRDAFELYPSVRGAH